MKYNLKMLLVRTAVLWPYKKELYENLTYKENLFFYFSATTFVIFGAEDQWHTNKCMSTVMEHKTSFLYDFWVQIN